MQYTQYLSISYLHNIAFNIFFKYEHYCTPLTIIKSILLIITIIKFCKYNIDTQRYRYYTKLFEKDWTNFKKW